VAAGYEVHLNLSPVVQPDGWEAAWAALLQRLDDEPSPTTKQPEHSRNGPDDVRYRNDVKRDGVQRLQRLIEQQAPWLLVRYAL
jgi:hypothetical protein